MIVPAKNPLGFHFLWGTPNRPILGRKLRSFPLQFEPSIKKKEKHVKKTKKQKNIWCRVYNKFWGEGRGSDAPSFLFIFSLESLQVEKKQQITRIIYFYFFIEGWGRAPLPANMITRLAVLALSRALRDPKGEHQLWVSGSFINL